MWEVVNEQSWEGGKMKGKYYLEYLNIFSNFKMHLQNSVDFCTSFLRSK
jgi:hypothetical protein